MQYKTANKARHNRASRWTRRYVARLCWRRCISLAIGRTQPRPRPYAKPTLCVGCREYTISLPPTVKPLNT